MALMEWIVDTCSYGIQSGMNCCICLPEGQSAQRQYFIFFHLSYTSAYLSYSGRRQFVCKMTSSQMAMSLPEGSKFYETCQRFKITAASFTSKSNTGKLMNQVGSYQDVYDRKSCPLCQLIAEAYKNARLPFGPNSTASWTNDLSIQRM